MFLLRVLGTVTLERQGGPRVSGRATQARQLALLAILALRPEDGWSRDQLAWLLWPDQDQERARHNVADALYVLRRQLGDDAIRSEGDRVRLDPERIRTDVGLFQTHLEAGAFDLAVRGYGGPFLEGFHLQGSPDTFEEWVDAERRRLADRYRTALETLAEEADEQGDGQSAVARWKSLTALDPYSTRYTVGLMGALASEGDPAAAVREAQRHELLLEEEFGLPTPPELSEALAAVREGRAAGRIVPPTPGQAARSPYTPAGSDGARGPLARPAVAAVLLVIAASLLWLLTSDWRTWRERSTTDRPDRAAAAAADPGRVLDPKTIAVLPFTDLSPGGDGDYFGAGFAEELLHRLARTEGFKVIASTSSFRLAERPVDVRAIGDSLGAGSLVEGSVRRAGDRVRLSARLVDARDGHQRWAAHYDVHFDIRELLTVEEDIAQAIADTLGVLLAGPSGTVATASPPSDLEAYSLYLLGRHHWRQRTPASFRRALELYDSALARDPTLPEAWSALGELYVLVLTSSNLADLTPGFLTREEAQLRGWAAVDRALELDPMAPQAQTALGQLLRTAGDEAGAESAFRTAIALEPSYATAHQWLAFLLGSRGEGAEALDELRTAWRLDPFSVSINGDLGRFLYYARRFDQAISQLDRTLELGPYQQAERFAVLALSGAGRHAEATRRARALDSRELDPRLMLTLRGVVTASAGHEDAAREMLAELKRSLSPSEASDGFEPFGTPRGIGWIHSVLGEADSAFAWLDRVANWGAGHRLWLYNDPSLDVLRADPRFAELQSRVSPALGLSSR